MIKRLVKLTFHPEYSEQFIAIFEQSKNLIRQMEGCQHVELLRCTPQTHVFFTLSLWDNEDRLNAYRGSELFRVTWAKTKILFSDKPQAWTTEVVSESTTIH